MRNLKKCVAAAVVFLCAALSFADGEKKLETIVDNFWNKGGEVVKIVEKDKITYKTRNSIAVMEVNGDMITIYANTPSIYKSIIFGYADGKYNISSDDNANIIIVRN